MREKKRLSWRQWMTGCFAMIALSGGWHKLTDSARPGSYTWMFDMSLIVIGTIGLFATLLWPRKDKPSNRP